MTEEKRQLYIDVGIDVDGTVERFLDKEDLFEHILDVFASDNKYSLMKTAVEEKNEKMAEYYAHSLKGSCANAGIMPLFEQFARLSDRFKQGIMVFTAEERENLDKLYLETLTAIEQAKLLS